MLLLAARSASQGPRSGFVTLAGIQLGTYVHAAAAALGLSQLFMLVPLAYDIVRWGGAVYLAYLAWTTWRSAGPAAVTPTVTQSVPLGRVFQQGLLTNILNPKMVLFVLALFPQFVDVGAGSVGVQIMVLATILNGIGLVVNSVVILTVSRARRFWQGGGRLAHLPQYALSAVLAGLAVRLALASRP